MSDDGPGIAAELEECIFEKGYTTRVGSTGLGLAMSRELLGFIGGTLTLRSGSPQNCTFQITLPIIEIAD